MKFDKSLEFDQHAIEDLSYWLQKDSCKVGKIMSLIQEIHKDPFNGAEKLEPLKYPLTGCWSYCIDQEHRIVYSVDDEKIRIISCRYYYFNMENFV